MRPARTSGAVLAALAVAGAAGCGLFGRDEPPPCPPISVLADGAELVRFAAGPGRDLIDVNFQGQVADAFAGCEYEIDDETETGTLTVEINPVFEVTRGPANHDRVAAFEYFVGLVEHKPDGPVIHSRPRFDVTVEFPGNQTTVQYLEETPVTIVVPLAAGQTGTDFEVFFGLQLSREELDYNRRRRQTNR